MGIKGKDFVLVAGDTSATQQIITIKHDEDKLVHIDDHKLMCLSGELPSLLSCFDRMPIMACALLSYRNFGIGIRSS